MDDQQKQFIKRILRGILSIIVLFFIFWFAFQANYRLSTTREWVMSSIWRILIGIVVFAVLVAIVIFVLNYVGSKDFK